MGFFDKLLKRTWRHFKERGDDFNSEDELGLALQEYRAADSKFDGTDEERAELDACLCGVHTKLRGEQLALADRLLKAKQYDRARNALDSARSHCSTDEEREEIRVREQGLDDAIVDAPVAAAFEEIESDSEHAANDRFIVLLGGLEEDQADHYEGLGDGFRRGWLALQAGDIEVAQEELEGSLQEHPTDPFVRIELARAYVANERAEEAADLAEKADQDGDSIYIKLHRAEILWTLERFDVAERVLQAAHDLDEEEPRVFRAIGEHALRSGDYQPGIEAIEIMLEDASTDVTLLRMAGQLHHAAGNLDDALQYYESVLAIRWTIDPDTHELVFDPTSAFSAAQIYLALELKPDRVIDLLHAMLTVTQGPASATIYALMAEAHVLKKRPKDAREALGKALSLIPEAEEEAREVINQRLEELD